MGDVKDPLIEALQANNQPLLGQISQLRTENDALQAKNDQLQHDLRHAQV